jgi:allantoate deiminase
MLFVPSRDGRSHTPAEFTATSDAVTGIRVLTDALHGLAYPA